MVLQNPLPNQGMVATQPLVQQNTATTSLSHLIVTGVYHIMKLSYDVNLHSRKNQYGSTTTTINTSTKYTSTALDMSLHLPRLPTDQTSNIPRFPMHHVVNNPTARVALNYNIVDDLAQSPSAMYDLEVLKNFPLQCKALLSA